MAEVEDWRLNGQERYLGRAVLHWAKWHRPRPAWDHDHCAFCWAKFMDEPHPDVFRAGYTTPDKYHWICSACFRDFRELFGWQVEDSGGEA